MKFHKNICAAVFATLSSGIAHAQHNPVWECQLIRDIGAHMSSNIDPERGDIVHYSTEFKRDEIGRWASFEQLLQALTPRLEDQYNSEATDEIARTRQNAARKLTMAMVYDSWANYQSLFQVYCPEMGNVAWSSSDMISERINETMEDIIRRTGLPQNHPEHLPLENMSSCGWLGREIPRLEFIHISRPVFSETGDLALVLSDPSGSTTLYEKNNGEWEVAVTLIPMFC